MSEPQTTSQPQTASQPQAVTEKRVTWAELFFDLVFVFAITQVSVLLHDDHSAAGMLRAAVVFVPIYWAWVGMTVYANTHDVDNPIDRMGMFAVGLLSLFMALALPDAYGDRGLLFAVSYLLLRALLAALVYRGQVRAVLNVFSATAVFTGPLLVAGAFLDGWARVGVWAVGGVASLAMPALFRRRLTRLQYDTAHMPERFGLFLIIALGESIVAVGRPAAEAKHLSAAVVVAVALSFVLACGLWWVYFHFAASAVHHGLVIARVQTDVVRSVLSYGHLLFIAAIIAVSGGLAEVVAHPDHHLDGSVTALLFGGCALYLATFGYTRWRMFRTFGKTRPVATVVVLALVPLAGVLPALVALGLLAAVVLALNIAEYVVVRRAARTAPPEPAPAS